MERDLRRSGLPGDIQFKVEVNNAQLPAMKAKHNLEEDSWLFGESDIYSYLLDNQMVRNLDHQTFSGWTSEGCT